MFKNHARNQELRQLLASGGSLEGVDFGHADLAKADEHPPYERIDGLTPVNDRYNASVGSLMGIGVPEVFSSMKVDVSEGNKLSFPKDLSGPVRFDPAP